MQRVLLRGHNILSLQRGSYRGPQYFNFTEGFTHGATTVHICLKVLIIGNNIYMYCMKKGQKISQTYHYM